MLVFQKVTSTRTGDGYTYTAVDYIAVEHTLAYVVHQGQAGWTVTGIDPDDRPATADRTYNPPSYLTGV